MKARLKYLSPFGLWLAVAAFVGLVGLWLLFVT